MMVAGVNGTGKTTTIGKLAWHLRGSSARGCSWAPPTRSAPPPSSSSRGGPAAGGEIVRGAAGSDPGAVAFEAVKRGRELGVDVVIIDTAGRLHTQDDLMAELAKVSRVIGKQLAAHRTRRC